MLCHTPHDHCPDVSNIIVSGFTKRGQKEVNQDALLFIEVIIMGFCMPEACMNATLEMMGAWYYFLVHSAIVQEGF
ncbi:hypothetical protein KP509_06G031000 [Ceratopteris richardii]|uniref:Uncharacterized protein n=1 Tax=Ceratopteris richardii TaxID=49495 RepID=A0A8T2UF45_CERRI|nr:hypothetical protein KP509_06G031000 [Ceratopteris richardii]